MTLREKALSVVKLEEWDKYIKNWRATRNDPKEWVSLWFTTISRLDPRNNANLLYQALQENNIPFNIEFRFEVKVVINSLPSKYHITDPRQVSKLKIENGVLWYYDVPVPVILEMEARSI